MPRSKKYLKLQWLPCATEEFTWYESDEFEGQSIWHPMVGILYRIVIKKQEYINDVPIGSPQNKVYMFYMQDDTPLEPHQLTIANLTEMCKKYSQKMEISSWYESH